MPMKTDTRNINPLLEDTEYPPFHRIRMEHYLPAFRESIASAEAEFARIASGSGPATFANTIAAIDAAGRDFDRVAGIFFNLLEAEASPEMQRVAEEVVPMTTEYENRYFLNENLFRRVSAACECKDGLPEEERMLAQKIYDGFVRHGALLQGEARERYREVNRLLSEKCLQYKNNVLAATAAYELYFPEEEAEGVRGLPEAEKQIAAEKARAKGHASGWSFDLSQPSSTAYLKHAENRGCREQLYKAYNSRALGGAHDNAGLIRDIVNLRAELARLMGYGTYAAYVLDKRMLRTAGEVDGLLDRLLEAFRPVAEKELEEITAFAHARGFEGVLQPWDWPYWQTRFQEEKLAFDEQQLRPYFPLEKVRGGVFALAGRLYGLTFVRRDDVPVYHPQVEVYEVHAEGNGRIALLYMDYFPRDSKRNGAWMTSFRDSWTTTGGRRVEPQVSLVFNFTPATADRPSLLSFREVETLLHEFGHALHGMLSQTKYVSLSGTSVVRDFVELPSQIMENWAQEKEFLQLFARHYQSGEVIPDVWMEKVRKNSDFCIGYATLRQLNFGRLDMAWHTLGEDFSGDVEAFEAAATRETQLLPTVPHTGISTSFTHIFGGGYAAGYYGYKWAEVLSDDAYEEFARGGVFSAEVASRFREHILSRGGSADAMELYVRFKGRRPTADAMLEKHGLSRQYNKNQE